MQTWQNVFFLSFSLTHLAYLSGTSWTKEKYRIKASHIFRWKHHLRWSRKSLDLVSLWQQLFSMPLSVFKGSCHTLMPFRKVTVYAEHSPAHFVGRRGWEWERSVHYACVLTFDGLPSSVSKTKARPDGHLMCTAIYCQSGRGKQREAVLLQLPPEVCLMEITCM